MKRKMLTVIGVIAAVVIIVLAGWYVAFCKFGLGPVFPFVKTIELENIQPMPEIAENPLMAQTDSEEQARETAELYGITFVSYENGIALFWTDEDIYEVIARGQKKGYPQLSVNYTRELHDTEETIDQTFEVERETE